MWALSTVRDSGIVIAHAPPSLHCTYQGASAPPRCALRGCAPVSKQNVNRPQTIARTRCAVWWVVSQRHCQHYQHCRRQREHNSSTSVCVGQQHKTAKNRIAAHRVMHSLDACPVSITCEEIRPIASGALRRSPRASLLCASIPTCASSSLVISRGLRCRWRRCGIMLDINAPAPGRSPRDRAGATPRPALPPRTCVSTVRRAKWLAVFAPHARASARAAFCIPMRCDIVAAWVHTAALLPRRAVCGLLCRNGKHKRQVRKMACPNV